MMRNFSKGVSDYVFMDFGDEFEEPSDAEAETVEEILYHRFDLETWQEIKEEVEAASTDIPEEKSGPEPVSVLAPDVEKIIREAEDRAEHILTEAEESAEKIMEDARNDAEKLSEEASGRGYAEGYDKGMAEGREQALKESREELEEQNRSLLDEVSRAITEMERQKTDYIRQYSEEMKDLVIAIAEKVIKISLKSSSEVIRRMILSAVESGYEKQWAKIYISDYDANLMVREDSDILDALRNVSDKIQIVVMENGEPGDLIVEYPNQAVDASVNTQLENIREIMQNAR